VRFFEKRERFRTILPKLTEEGGRAGKRVYRFSDGSKITDTIKKEAPYLTKITRTWEIAGKGSCKLYFEWDTDDSFDDWFIPSVIYRENRDGMGSFPRGGIDSAWEFREDRMGIPGAIFLLKKNRVAGIFTEPARDETNIASCGVRRTKKGHVLYLSFPSTEAPRRYVSKGIIVSAFGRRKRRYFKSEDRLTYKRTIYLYKDTSLDYYSVFTYAHTAFGKKQKPITKRDLAVQIDLRKRHIADYLYYERGDVAGIKRGKNDNPIISWLYSDIVGGAFLERGIQAAYLLYLLGERKKAKKISDFLLKGQMENGLAWVCYHLHKKRWGGAFLPFPPYLNERVPLLALGQMGYFYLKLFRECGEEAYFEYARKAADFLIKNQKRNGSYGRIFDPDGRRFDDAGASGAYGGILVLELFSITGDKKYRDSALKSVEYFKRVAERGEYIGGALDSDCVDKEAAGILLKLFLHAFEVNGDRVLLDYAHRAAETILTWVWSYDVTFPNGSLLAREKFSTTGMTSVSVAHHHLDFFGAELAVDLLKLDSFAKTKRYEKIALSMIAAPFQLLNGFMGRKNRKFPKIIGWQPEQINQTDWDYMHPLISGGKGVYQYIAAWTPVLVLGALMELREMDKKLK
jgi:hypothetical protein